MRTCRPDPRRNRLLAALPASTWRRLQGYLTPVKLPVGFMGKPERRGEVPQVYFPIDAVVALVHVMDNGAWSETALVGNEGFVGVTLLLGGTSTGAWPYVQSDGHAYCLSQTIVQWNFEREPAFQQTVLRYTQALLAQMAQTAACNRYHTIDQQLCRWLLLTLDRLPGNELEITQSTIANLLGVRREGVTTAAVALQKLGIIRYRRGKIAVTDRSGLEERCCECYQAVRTEYARLLPNESGLEPPPLDERITGSSGF